MARCLINELPPEDASWAEAVLHEVLDQHPVILDFWLLRAHNCGSWIVRLIVGLLGVTTAVVVEPRDQNPAALRAVILSLVQHARHERERQLIGDRQAPVRKLSWES